MDNIQIAFELAHDIKVLEKNGNHCVAEQIINVIDELVGKWKIINDTRCFVWPRPVAKLVGISYIRKKEI